jgi:hypothetical protein
MRRRRRRIGHEQRERVPAAIGHRAPQPRKAEPSPALVNFQFDFGGFRTGEFEENGRPDQGNALLETVVSRSGN